MGNNCSISSDFGYKNQLLGYISVVQNNSPISRPLKSNLIAFKMLVIGVRKDYKY